MDKPNSPNVPGYIINSNRSAALPEQLLPINAASENSNTGEGACDYKQGELPPCAPLAAAFVPYQQKKSPKYGNNEALTRGTLFPGLDLPFMNTANKNNPYAGTPLGDLMAIDFAKHELVLYLDTHKDDTEAFEMFKQLNALEKEGREKFVKLYGPVNTSDLAYAARYTWTDDPWPWEYHERGTKS